MSSFKCVTNRKENLITFDIQWSTPIFMFDDLPSFPTVADQSETSFKFMIVTIPNSDEVLIIE